MIYISKYKVAQSKEPLKVEMLDEIYKIREGFYKSEIERCRLAITSGDRDLYKKIKSGLPALTFSGFFKGAHKKENIEEYSHYIVLDIDNLSREIVDTKKKELFSDDFVFACWLSPSGVGLKALVRVSSSEELHKFCFDALVKYLQEKFELDIDKSGSDTCRLCYVSYDPNLLLKENSVTFEFVNSQPSESNKVFVWKTKAQLSQIIDPVNNLSLNESVLFNKTEGRNSSYDRILIGKIITFLKKHKLSITSSYSNWVSVAFAISNCFTYDIGRKYFQALCEMDGLNHDSYKSEKLLEYCYRNRRGDEVNFGTIIYLAKQRGFELKNIPMKQ